MTNENTTPPVGPGRATGWGGRLRTITLLVVASFLVGAVLTLANISPLQLWESVARGIYNLVEAFLDTGWETIKTGLVYVVAGAIIVLPIWAIVKLFSLRR